MDLHHETKHQLIGKKKVKVDIIGESKDTQFHSCKKKGWQLGTYLNTDNTYVFIVYCGNIKQHYIYLDEGI